MTREEKVEVIFESILSEIERISDTIKSGDNGKVKNDFSHLDQKLEGFLKKLSSAKLNIQQLNLTPFDKKLDVTIDNLNNNVSNTSAADNIIGAKASNSKLNHILTHSLTRKLRYIIVVILILSLGANYYLTVRHNIYKKGHEKYEFLYHSGNSKYLQELDSIWEIDSLRNDRIHFIQLRKSEGDIVLE
ncbi:MAG: hypothetical protein O2951_12610 [Bacteroidetes bacterium]|nr:hypothetical protein [Bacteroidota bacterium]